MNKNRTIRITGKANLKVHPDITRITITLTGLDKEYGHTLQHSAEKTDALRTIIKSLGFKRSDLKTLHFSVDTENEPYRENDVFKKRFIGYSFTHKLKVEFDSDNKRLGEILSALTNSSLEATFEISYTVKDPESIKNELLAKAVKDAREKAQALTDTAQVKLGKILNIDYSWNEFVFTTEPMYEMAMPAFYSKKVNLDIEPDDIDTSDTVTIIWEID